MYIVGSSYVYWAGLEKMDEVSNLGRNNLAVNWHGTRGLTLDKLDTEMDTIFRQDKYPKFVLIHCGSNDLTTEGMTGKYIIEKIKTSFLRYKALFSKTILIWSSILPRRYWHYAPLGTGAQIDKKRKRVNAAVRAFVLESGGKIINNDSYINVTEVSLYRQDGCHLSKLGNEVLIKNWKLAVNLFLETNTSQYPSPHFVANELSK